MKQGELVERLRGWQGDMPDALKDDLQKAATRLAELEEANRVLREALIRARPHVAASRRPYDTAQQRYELLTDIDAALTPSGEQPS